MLQRENPQDCPEEGMCSYKDAGVVCRVVRTCAFDFPHKCLSQTACTCHGHDLARMSEAAMVKQLILLEVLWESIP